MSAEGIAGQQITQRGNGRARTFFGKGDYALYRGLLATNCRATGGAVALGTLLAAVTLPVVVIVAGVR
ncbi:hypothetical protein M2171_002027 [Bradyrhizobium japonicum USDA 38]|uniref:hypothetical protein n=1 Tax=Bradyrhizobium japonicum TaxID=375 RepID=UPI0003FCFEAB|nr:hypothetical protein [Bradyrhizobium japonicum]MCS3892894.1 hypothetical protein [Bradyrhizobium japonicum USDA 38]MCS3945407.1 hypothetical protein [Bradyrhizobium japonicum]